MVHNPFGWTNLGAMKAPFESYDFEVTQKHEKILRISLFSGTSFSFIQKEWHGVHISAAISME